MILRSVTFVVVCAPVWLLYASTPLSTPGLKRLPAASAVVWTGVQGTLCFAGPATRARERSRCGHGRRIRVTRRRRRAVRVPAVRMVQSAGREAAAPGPIDIRLWHRVQRAMGVPADATGRQIVAIARPARRAAVVRFFEGRVTLCGVGGRVIENPCCVPPDATAAAAGAGASRDGVRLDGGCGSG